MVEFKQQALLVNPTLAESDGRFVADQDYLLPDGSTLLPAIVWNRKVTGYAGSPYQAWLDLVQGKVSGLDYATFRRQLTAYNPVLTEDGGQLHSARAYLLPRSAGAERYYVTATTAARGNFRFTALPIGSYILEIDTPGLPPLRERLTVTNDVRVDVQLGEPIGLPQMAHESPLARVTLNRMESLYAQAWMAVRQAPGYVGKPGQEIVGIFAPGAMMQIVGTDAEQDRLFWWHVRGTQSDGATVEGWVPEATAEMVMLGNIAPRLPRGASYVLTSGLRRDYAQSYLNLRNSPGYVGKAADDVLGEIPRGAPVIIMEGPQSGGSAALVASGPLCSTTVSAPVGLPKMPPMGRVCWQKTDQRWSPR
ncbi:MAG: carboxypeptidase-like regulatory domain-containing protein [Caldilineaceae bacterium]